MTETPGRGWSSASGTAETADVLLLRHGATRLTPQKRFSGLGTGSTGLSASGRDQAVRASKSTLVQRGWSDRDHLLATAPLHGDGRDPR